jgi:diguanylate cyclase (GGDEF)-like protein
MKNTLAHWFFGSVQFEPSEEFDAFRYKFLIIAMVAAGLLTGVFIASSYSALNTIALEHMISMHVFTAAAMLCWLILRGRKHLFRRVAWSYEVMAMAEYTSALLNAPQDELRLLWFFTNIPGVFMLLGKRAGWAITVITIGILWVGNAHMTPAYSSAAMMTCVSALLYLAVFFHVFGDRSISYFKRMQAYNLELERLASHDTLTGVLNARAYYSLCDQGIRLATRSGRAFSVLFIDLDHFKSINDRHGHAAGDTVLKETARCLIQGVRTSDHVGRIGGEEFSVFLPDTGALQAFDLAEHLRQRLEALCPHIDSGPIRITASIGVACSEGRFESMSEIQQRADQAMYAAKAQGRNRVALLTGPDAGATALPQ